MDYKKLVFTLNKVGIALGSEMNLEKLLDLLIIKIIEFAKCDACSLYLREYNPDRLLFQSSRTMSLQDRKERLKSIQVPLETKSISGFVALTGEVVNIKDCNNIENDKKYKFNDSFDKQTGYKTVSMLAVPLKNNKGKIVGVVQLINKFNNNNEIISFPKEFEEIVLSLAGQAAVAIDNANLLEANKNLYKALVRAFSESIEARSPHTAGHSKRVAFISEKISKAINNTVEGKYAKLFFSKEELEELKYAALLHDVGKVAVSEKILEKGNKLTEQNIETIKERFGKIKFSVLLSEKNKEFANNKIIEIQKELNFILQKNIPGFLIDEDKARLKLISQKKYQDLDGIYKNYLTSDEYYNLKIEKGSFTPEEKTEMQNHVLYSLDLLQEIPFTEELKNIPLYAGAHHEMLDGSGYPAQIKGKSIPIQSRILAVADIFEALTAADRPYKKAIPLPIALKILKEEADRGKLDKEIVNIFLNNKIYDIYLKNKETI